MIYRVGINIDTQVRTRGAIPRVNGKPLPFLMIVRGLGISRTGSEDILLPDVPVVFAFDDVEEVKRILSEKIDNLMSSMEETDVSSVGLR